MANERRFLERRAYERQFTQPRPTDDRTLQHRAWALVVIGVGCLLVGKASGDALAVTVGVISFTAGGIWRLWLSIPDP